MLIGSGVIQVGTRSPVTIAQTAMTLAHLSGGRFLLGLGVSGPQVMEGLHGVPFGHPLGRMRETVEIVRQTFTGEKVTYAGRHYGLPLPGGYGSKPMRVSLPPVSVPVYLATLSPKMLELTGEIADGWLGTSFVPEGSAAYFTHLDAGLARSGRTRRDLDVCQGAEVAFAADDGELAGVVDARRPGLAFSLGGMGSATTNYYNAAYSRQGWGEVAACQPASAHCGIASKIGLASPSRNGGSDVLYFLGVVIGWVITARAMAIWPFKPFRISWLNTSATKPISL